MVTRMTKSTPDFVLTSAAVDPLSIHDDDPGVHRLLALKLHVDAKCSVDAFGMTTSTSAVSLHFSPLVGPPGSMSVED